MNATIDMSRSIPRLALNRSEVAISIGCSANTVDLMVKEGVLPPPRRWHSRKVWLVSEIMAAMEEWPEDQAQQRTAQAPQTDDDWGASV